jgi:hypothetical protein
MPSRRAWTPGATRSASPADTVATVVELTCGAATLPGLPADLSLPQPFRDAALPGRRIAAFADAGLRLRRARLPCRLDAERTVAGPRGRGAGGHGLRRPGAGALVLPRIERSARPASLYAACEATIAVWSLVLIDCWRRSAGCWASSATALARLAMGGRFRRNPRRAAAGHRRRGRDAGHGSARWHPPATADATCPRCMPATAAGVVLGSASPPPSGSCRPSGWERR